MGWDVKLRGPIERADAIPLEALEADVEGRSVTAGEAGIIGIEDTLWDDLWRATLCLRNCKALASAFSCVRTKLASSLMKVSPSVEFIFRESSTWEGRE